MTTEKITLALSTVLLLTVSCHVYKDYDKEAFPTYAWRAGQAVQFTPNIEDISKTYKLTLGIRHLYGFQFSSFAVNVRIVSPSGKESTKTYQLAIKDKENNYISNCAGDMCDLEVIVDDNIKYEEAGQYQYFITHNEDADKVVGVMEFGLIIDSKE